jgi:V/A-type H+/Na+-transporting ATPase subunit I
MAIYRTKGLLLTLRPNQLNPLIKQIVENELPVEFLNPSDLGSDWKQLEFTTPDSEKESADLQQLNLLFKYYPASGFWSNFEDTRVEFTANELKRVLASRKDLMYIAERLILLKDSQKSVKILGKNKKTKIKNASQISTLEAQINHIYHEIGIDDQKIVDILIPELKKLYSAIEVEKKIKELPKYIFKVEKNAQTLFGFIAYPLSKEKEVMAILNSIDVVREEIEWNKEMVVWEDKNLESFKQIPESLGTVDQKEVDPTPIISFFFAFFFALAINDALYGLIIALFTGYVLYFRKIKPALKNIFGLLFVSGLFSLVVGSFTGSWAGNLLEKSPLSGLLSSVQLIKQIPSAEDHHLPIVNEYLNNNLGGTSPVVALLAFAVLVGLVHIFTALSLKAINAYKGGHYHHFITEVAWIAFLISGISYLAAGNAPLKPLLFIPIIGFLALVFIYNSGKTILGKILKGLIQVYELVSFLADILSYTRLIAIGLTGAIIADVINLLARLVYDSNLSIFGAIIFVIILVIGHLFNLVVGLFGAYINPLRLHYVEFLPKFYQGKARQLKTLDSNLTYAIIKT